MSSTNFLAQKELKNLLQSGNSRPYIFRTRLERTIERVQYLAEIENNQDIKTRCLNLKNKLNFISDQSNQTSDGTLRSFSYLKKDIVEVLELIQ